MLGSQQLAIYSLSSVLCKRTFWRYVTYRCAPPSSCRARTGSSQARTTCRSACSTTTLWRGCTPSRHTLTMSGASPYTPHSHTSSPAVVSGKKLTWGWSWRLIFFAISYCRNGCQFSSYLFIQFQKHLPTAPSWQHSSAKKTMLHSILPFHLSSFDFEL